MVAKAQTVTVGTTATILSGAVQRLKGQYQFGIVSSVIMVPAGGQTVYVGGSDVTATNGFPLAAGMTLAPDLTAGDDTLYGVVANGSQQVNVLSTGL